LRHGAGTFTNGGSITIGANMQEGTTGIINQAIFNNSGCTALLNLVGNVRIQNTGTFTNSGLIVENASGTSSVTSNTGLV